MNHETVLIILAVYGTHAPVLMPLLLRVGMTTMIAIPTIQVRLTRMSPEAPTLMGAMNMASRNVATAIGAWAGGTAIRPGLGLYSTVWVGFGLTAAGSALFAMAFPVARAVEPRP